MGHYNIFNKKFIFAASIGVLFSLNTEQSHDLILDFNFTNGRTNFVTFKKKVAEFSHQEQAFYELFSQELDSISKEAYQKIDALIKKHTSILKACCKINNDKIPLVSIQVNISPQLN